MANQENLRQFVEKFEGNRDPKFVEAVWNIASAMVEVSANVQEGQQVLLWFDNAGGIQLVQDLYQRCLARGAEVDFFMRDLTEDARGLADCEADQVTEFFLNERTKMDKADIVLIVRGPENPEALQALSPELRAAYGREYGKAHERRNDGTLAWTLIEWPTEYEAKKEGLRYEEYLEVFLEACNQPWEEIRKAQQILVEMLNKGETLELIANDSDPDLGKRTRVTMSIKGMTFANSTISKNMPGSEVFSAPVLDSVEGQIFAPGLYLYEGFLMRNILLRIKQGVIVEAIAEEGNDGLQAILNQTEAARRFGEVALGTNPGLNRRFFNALLNEKVGGSFHMAIGHCYTFTHYDGEEVNVNNGNIERGSPHWDLTILMHRNADGSGGGMVILDGKVIQEDGSFTDPRLAILNPRKSD